MRRLQGIAASRGIALGPALRFSRPQIACRRYTVSDTDAEWARFQTALQGAHQQLAAIASRARDLSGEENAAIFQAQMLMLEDPVLLEAVRSTIKDQCTNAEVALVDAEAVQVRLLEALEDEYLRARAADVRDVVQRLLRILTGVPDRTLAEGAPDRTATPVVILADNLAPTDTLALDRTRVLGFCTAEGGPTSHTAILARGLGLPAVVGAGPAILDVPDGTAVVLDGSAGVLIVEPGAEALTSYKHRRVLAARLAAQAQSGAHAPAVTPDGRRAAVLANIGDVESARAALEAGAEGAGLVRTEFLYMGRAHWPDEEEQYRAYRALADAFGTLPVVLRTLDVGGDKRLPYLDLPLEPNPSLGLRAIRLCLARPELLKTQLRAALRAGVDRRVKVMFPMVATVAEVRAARALLDESCAELASCGVSLPTHVEVGVMVETPAAALLAGTLAREVGFLSIGTNDLAQYTAAADRTNASVAALASAFQPPVLRLVHTIIAAAHAHGRPVSLCGELAAEPLAIPILLGLGLDEFSVSPPAIPLVKELIRALPFQEARSLALAALGLESAEAVQELVRERVPAAADAG